MNNPRENEAFAPILYQMISTAFCVIVIISNIIFGKQLGTLLQQLA
jgi:hypothetical protein